MIGRAVAWSTHHAVPVIALILVLAVGGGIAWSELGRDAIPDLSSPQIVLVADWMGHPADAVARQVTSVLTAALEGVPGATAVRGSSMSGMAYLDVVFESTADLEAGRRAILDRLARAPRLPDNVRLEIGPVASSTGWVLEYALVDPGRKQSALTMQRLQDEVLRPALAAIPGVVEVASVGGGVQQVVVEAIPAQMRARRVALDEVIQAVRAALVDRSAMTLEEVEAAVIPVAGMTPADERIRVGDVARVRLRDDMPTGLADLGGIQPAVGGIVVAGRGANIPRVLDAVRRALEEKRRALPAGVELVTVYDRGDVIGRVATTLMRALAEEVLVVGLVILAFLVSGRSALIPLITLPVVLLLTFGAMWLLDVPATVMSLGGIGIALGMAVDADVVALEACHRRIEGVAPGAGDADQRTRLIDAAGSFAPAILTSLMITALSFLPVFAFTGESGRLLRPLALGKTLVIGSAALVTLTLAPALRERLLPRHVRPELENPLTARLVLLYRPLVHFALKKPVLTISTAVLALVSCLPIIGRLGGEFLPRIDEGDLLFMPTTLPGVSGDLTAAQLLRQDRALRALPEVSSVFGKVGRANTATDPAPYFMIETTVRLRPPAEWPALPRRRWFSGWAPGPLRSWLGAVWPEATPRTTAELVEELEERAHLPGWVDAWTAPVRARLDMMATGIRTPVGIRIVAKDPARLAALGEEIRARVEHIPGTRSAVFESLGGEPWVRFEADAAALRDLDVEPGLAESTANVLSTGGQIGEIELGGQRLRVRISPDSHMSSMMPGRVPESLHGPADDLREATVRARSGAVVPLLLVGRVGYVREPAMVRVERGEQVAYVHLDLAAGTDVLRYVDAARRTLESALAKGGGKLEPGERIEWTGQYELLAAGQRRLGEIVPIVAISMILLLLVQFRSLTEALIVLISVPFALVGSFWTLYLLGYAMSAPVWVGLLSVVGLAMQTGVVMVVYIDEAFHRRVRAGRLVTREDIVEAHAEGTVLRLRPKIMTITTMASGLLPLLWAEGAGAEIMRRVAAPMLGGLLSSAFLTLEVLPVLYTMWRHRQLLRAQRLGVPLEEIVGPAPSWARE